MQTHPGEARGPLEKVLGAWQSASAPPEKSSSAWDAYKPLVFSAASLGRSMLLPSMDRLQQFLPRLLSPETTSFLPLKLWDA